MFEKIRKWYEGEFVAHENDPNSFLVFTGGFYKRHWTAKAARSLVTFYLSHWQWLWSASLVIVGLYIAFLKLPSN